MGAAVPTHALMMAQRIEPATAFAIDGHAAAGGTSVSLTTTKSGDLIIGLGYSSSIAGFIPGSFSGGGLTWNLRKRFQVSWIAGVTVSNTMELWWAIATGTLSAASLSSGMAIGSQSGFVAAFGVSGAKNSAPWDTNAALPATAQQTGGGAATPSVGITTSNANDLLICVKSDQANGIGGLTEGTGWTRLDGAWETKIVNATQSGATGEWSGTASQWMILADAIRQGP